MNLVTKIDIYNLSRGYEIHIFDFKHLKHLIDEKINS